jgi:tetrahydrodipicolinate N-succinyltransferase
MDIVMTNKMLIMKIVTRFPEVISKIINWLWYGLYNSAVCGDPRFLFASISSQKLPLSTNIPHPVGIVVGRGCLIGKNVTILQNVTLGIRGWDERTDGPTIGDNVRICCGAIVLGDITLGDNSTIGANAVVLSDVPEGAVVAGVPAKRIDEQSE